MSNLTNMNKVIIYTDGGARGNPGPAGAGVVVMDEAGQTLGEAAVPLGKMSNNEAEYWAVIHGLELAKKVLGKTKLAAAEVELKLDSELVARQLLGEYQIKEEHLGKLFLKIWNLRVKDFKRLRVTHVRREGNARADALANRAMDQLV